MTAADLEKLLAEVTPGEWRSVAMGRSSTVLSRTMPPRNDQRANCTYGFQGDEFCVAYPFIEDDGKSFRPDFVCFGHDDARLIAMAPTLARKVIAAEKLVVALSEIARKTKTDELATECDVEFADFEDGYDACIDRAREALAAYEAAQ